MTADILVNKKDNPIVTELFIIYFIFLFYLIVYFFIYNISIQNARSSIYIFTKYIKTIAF